MMIVEDTLRTCSEYLSVAQRDETVEDWAQTFHSLVLWGKLRTALRWIKEWETGGVLQTGERCTKTGDQVMGVLHSKHLEASAPTASSLYSYPNQTPELVPVYITDDTVTAVAGRISGRARPGGIDSVSLQHWFLRFGASSG